MVVLCLAGIDKRAQCCEGCVQVQDVFFFFFQAEDGIRDHCVTGVQTCALPIYTGKHWKHPFLSREPSEPSVPKQKNI